MSIRPVVFVWTGQVMVPLPRYMKQCRDQYLVNAEYPLALLEARSRASHSHYFASIHEGWLNLPEKIAHDFPSAEHLRKWCLIQAGYCTERNLVCDSAEHADALATLAGQADDFALVAVKGNVVKIFRAASQDAGSMGREEFQKSKTEVLDLISGLLQIKPSELQAMGDQIFKREPKRRG